MARPYRLATYLTSILCTSIVSTALICSIITPPCFKPSCSNWSSHSISKGYFSWPSRTRQVEKFLPLERREGAHHDDFDYGSDMISRDLYHRKRLLQIGNSLRTQRLHTQSFKEIHPREQPFHGYVVSGGGDTNGYLLFLKPVDPSATSESNASPVSRGSSRRHRRRRHHRHGDNSYQHQHHRIQNHNRWEQMHQRSQPHLNAAATPSSNYRDSPRQQGVDQLSSHSYRTRNSSADQGRNYWVFRQAILSSSSILTRLSKHLGPLLPLPFIPQYHAMQNALLHLHFLVCNHHGIHTLYDGSTGSSSGGGSLKECFQSRYLDPFNYLDTSKNTHTPQSIPPHPVLAMLASNHLVRLGLLVILCVGVLYYFVTVMEQQIVEDALNIAASNWWGESTIASTRSQPPEPAATNNRRHVDSSATALGATTVAVSAVTAHSGTEPEVDAADLRMSNVVRGSSEEVANAPLNTATEHLDVLSAPIESQTSRNPHKASCQYNSSSSICHYESVGESSRCNSRRPSILSSSSPTSSATFATRDIQLQLDSHIADARQFKAADRITRRQRSWCSRRRGRPQTQNSNAGRSTFRDKRSTHRTTEIAAAVSSANTKKTSRVIVGSCSSTPSHNGKGRCSPTSTPRRNRARAARLGTK